MPKEEVFVMTHKFPRWWSMWIWDSISISGKSPDDPSSENWTCPLGNDSSKWHQENALFNC